FHPLAAPKLPPLQARDPAGIVGELHRPRLPAALRFSRGLPNGQPVPRIIPPLLKPSSDLLGRFGRARQSWALHLQNEARFRVSRAVAVSVLRFRKAGPCGTSLNGRVLRKLAQPETPWLLLNLPFSRIAVLVQRFQISEYTCEFFAPYAEFL